MENTIEHSYSHKHSTKQKPKDRKHMIYKKKLIMEKAILGNSRRVFFA